VFYYGNKITDYDKILKNVSWAQNENPRHPTINILRINEFFSASQHFFLDLAITRQAVFHLGVNGYVSVVREIEWGGGTNFFSTNL